MHVQSFAHTSKLPMCRTGKSLSLPTSGDIKKVRKIAALSLQQVPSGNTERLFKATLCLYFNLCSFFHAFFADLR